MNGVDVIATVDMLPSNLGQTITWRSGLQQCYPKCGPQKDIISITRALVKSANLWVPHRSTESESPPGYSPKVCIITSSMSDFLLKLESYCPTWQAWVFPRYRNKNLDDWLDFTFQVKASEYCKYYYRIRKSLIIKASPYLTQISKIIFVINSHDVAINKGLEEYHYQEEEQGLGLLTDMHR